LVRLAALTGAVSHAPALRICDPVCPRRVRTTQRCCPDRPAVAHRESKTSDIPHQKLGGNALRPRMAGLWPDRNATISTSTRSLEGVSQPSTPTLPCPRRKARCTPSSVYSRMSVNHQEERPLPSPALFR